MIIITGASGLIGSCLIQDLNNHGFENLVLVDDFSRQENNKNLINKKFVEKIHRDDFFEWFDANYGEIKFIFHIGARTDTTEKDQLLLDRLNLNYSKKIWNKCIQYNLPMVYASSAATYGLGEFGYDDDENKIKFLKPLNLYGESKNDFDKWALLQPQKPKFWAGLKFFNVYGPNEYHKGRMASVIFHTYNQIVRDGKMKLFQSHREDIKDGEQKRDFVYVKDVVKVLYFMMQNQEKSGIYNLGSGKARTFLDLATLTFNSLEKEVNISFVPTPEDIRDKYQYFTEAKMEKLILAGYTEPFYSLEDGINDYVKNYLLTNNYF